MNSPIDVYTRLKLRTDEKVIVSFYNEYGQKETITAILKDVIGFDYIVLKTIDSEISIPFFGLNSMIESITFVNTNRAVYYNPYINEDILLRQYTNNYEVEVIKRKMLGEGELNFENRNSFIQKFQMKKTPFTYDELFFSEKQKREFNDFFEELIKDLTRYCKDNNLDTNLSIIGGGGTSIVYSIGDKIIKIGKPRMKFTIPYCEYLLQPIINRDYEFDGYPIHVEVTQKVKVFKDTKNAWNNPQYLYILEQLSEDLYERGLKSNDLHPGNIGFLTSENRIHYDSINFDISDDITTSILNNNNLQPRDTGEFVIIDLDCLEIEDIMKYCMYLRSIGFPIEQVRKIKAEYNLFMQENNLYNKAL